MITQQTVLVLGAGASKPFGFPSGKELLERITRQICGHKPDQSTLGEALLAFGASELDVAQFGSALHHSQRNSVDAFLEFRPEFLNVGKAAIIASLIPYESPARLFEK